jgi:hypothetical protein
MTVVLLLCVLMPTVMGAWFTHRRRALLAWDRELNAAFPPSDRREMSHRRVL